MRIKQLFANLGMVLALSALFLSAPVFATGEEEPDLPDQSQETESPEKPEETGNPEDSSSDNSSIGGGLNADNEAQTTPDKPAQSETPSVSKPLSQPEDPVTEVQRPTTTPTTPATTKPTLPVITIKPHSQTSKPTATVTPATSTSTVVDEEETSASPVIIPTVPNDNIAPTDVETPRTGLIEPQTTPANPLAIILLVLAGITIIAAGIVSTILSKAGQRNQSAI